ncbi:hypothetical protein [Ferribacterium limneticum]|uniref:hypothetical protein n=1 Tax=Ferribacterium limneticum TaxID=76259 RepID=UPI001CF99C5A|nr:hypothetical protein [Ferribacterium limneticum]UCV18030.1 hypothetical protein KI610_14580 [Ferribacterium limneticum]
MDASALVNVNVHAEFPASGFASGPVYGTSGLQTFDVVFQIDETLATHYSAGYALVPGSFELAHDVYAIGYEAIVSASSFGFGNQFFHGTDLNNLSFALLQGGNLNAPIFLTDLTPGTSPLIEVIVAPNAELGSYTFGPFVLGEPRAVSLTNEARIFDGVNIASGTVQVSISAVPEPQAGLMMALGLLPIWLARKGLRS